MADRIRRHDWSRTPLGPVETWPERLRLMVEQVLANPLVATLACGPERLLIYNDAAACLYGNRHPGALGRPLAQAFPEGWATVAPFYARAFAGETVKVVTQPLDTRGEGASADLFDALLTPIRDASGHVAFVHMVGLEFGAPLRAEAALRARDAQYRYLFDAIDEGFCTIEVLFDEADHPTDYRFLTVNAAFERQTGLRDVIGQRMKDLVPSHEAHWFETYGRIALTGEPERFEDRADALGRWYEVFAFRTGAPEQRQVAVLFKDVLARKRAEQALRDSEVRFRAFVTASADVIYRMSPDWSEMRRLEGQAFLRDTDQPSQAWLEHYIHPDDRPMVRAAIDRAIRTRSVFELEHRVIRADGSLGWTFSRAVPIPGDEGGIKEWLGAATDVTAAKATQFARARAEAALRQSQTRLETILEALPVGVAVLDENGKVELSNAEMRRYMPTGLIPSRDPERVDRWRAWDAAGAPIGPSDFPGARALRGESTLPGLNMLFRTEAEDEIWISVANVPLADEKGRITGAISILSDIDTLKRSTEALRKSEERQAFLLKLSDTLRRVGDAGTIRAVACRMIGEHLSAARAYYVDYEAEAGFGLVAEDYAEPGLPSLSGRYPFEAFRTTYERIGGGTTWIVPDVAFDRDLASIERDFYLARGVVSWVNVPLLKEGRFKAAFCIVETEARNWTTFEVELIEDVAERLWAAVERGRAEAARRESEERQGLMLQLVPALLWWADPAGQDITMNDRWQSYTGQTEAETQNFGWLDAIHPDDLEATQTAFEHAFTTGEPLERQQRIRHHGKSYRWHLVRHVPVRDASGVILRWFGAAVDIHDYKLAEEALERSERLSRALIEGVPQLVWRAVDGGDWTWASPQWTGYTGRSDRDSHGRGWLEPVHPDDRTGALEQWRHAMERGRFEADYRLRHAADGRYRWFQTRATPVRGNAGDIIEWLGTSTDVDDLHQLQERQQVLVAELQHRTRNLLGVVRSVADRTAGGSATLEDFVPRFRERLEALSRINGLLSKLEQGQRVTFDEMIRNELGARGWLEADMSERIRLDGPTGVRLRSATVQTFALAIHELTTNAVKYGALCDDGGRLTVRWRVRPDEDGGSDHLHVEWIESEVADMPAPGDAPQGGGYGRELIERALPYQLKARTTYELQPDGVHCTIDLPLQ